MDPLCGCNKHDLWSQNKGYKINKLAWRKIRKSIVEGLTQDGYLPPNHSYLCTACAEYYESTILAPKTKKHNATAVDIAEAIKTGIYSMHDLALIAEAIGETIANDLYEDGLRVSQQYQNPDYLQNYNTQTWLCEANPVLVSFLKTATYCQNTSDTNKHERALANAVEQIYYCKNSNIITPLAFTSNLMSYYITGSKVACNAHAMSRPCGSYHSIVKWVEKQGHEPLQVTGQGDLVTFFDNSQVLARNWRVRYNAKALVSVITTLLHIIPGNDPCLQTDEAYRPSCWLRYDIPHLTASLPSFLDCDLSHFRQYRAHVISHIIQSVLSNQRPASVGYEDDFDQHCLPDSLDVGREASYRAVYDESSTKIRIVRSDSIAHRYALVEAGSLIVPDLVVGEPVLVNPCSYAAMKVVLNRILQDVGVGTARAWTVIGCDGLPYNLASRVISSTYKCPICDLSDITGSSKWAEHMYDEHNKTFPDPDEYLTYGAVLLVSGPGHMEINMTKASFKLLWHVVMKDLAKLLGFKSPKAQACCQNASDHHKAWQMIEIVFWGTGSELVVPYVRECQRSGRHPDVAGFSVWLSTVSNKNFLFLVDTVFTYIMALYLFRCGIRRGNHTLAHEAFSRFSDLFFGLNMTQYQELSIRHHHTIASSPEPVRAFLHRTTSYSASGSDSRGEGGDFILEAKNRRIQMWMPPGLPTSHHWQRICRNLDTLDSIREHLMEVPDRSDHHVELTREIRHWRHHLRHSRYLASPVSSGPHVSLSGKSLDPHLTAFARTCQDNKRRYVEDTTSGQPLGTHHKLQRLFVLAGEREEASDVTRKTNSDLCGMIVETIQRIRDAGSADLADSLDRQFQKDVRTGTKAVLLTFLQSASDTLTEVLELLESAQCGDEEDD